MEYQKITNLFGTTPNEMPRFITKKWVEVHDQSGEANDRHKPNKPMGFKTSMLRSGLCDFSDAYIVVKGVITVTNPDNAKRNKAVAFKNNAPFINCISKINGIKIDNAEDLDVVMPMYNLIEYSKNYRKTTGSLWNYCRDELSNDVNGNNNLNKNVINSKSFKYKTSITGSTYNVDARITNDAGNQVNNTAYDAHKSGKKEVEIAVPLKYLSNLWRTLNMTLINCEVSLILTWSENCVITSIKKKKRKNKYRRRYFSNKCNI